MEGNHWSRELVRKLFHLLTLVYLWFFWKFGSAMAVRLLGVWLAVEGILELARLKFPNFNRRLMSAFGSIHREEEASRVSGIFWTGLGCWGTILLFGRHPDVVWAAVMYLALGDASAALVGKAIGRRPLPFAAPKTWEGSLACFAVCAAIGWFLGFGAARIWAGAAAATIIEAVPMPFSDNFWLPLGSAFILWLMPF